MSIEVWYSMGLHSLHLSALTNTFPCYLFCTNKLSTSYTNQTGGKDEGWTWFPNLITSERLWVYGAAKVSLGSPDYHSMEQDQLDLVRRFKQMILQFETTKEFHHQLLNQDGAATLRMQLEEKCVFTSVTFIGQFLDGSSCDLFEDCHTGDEWLIGP